MVDAPHVGVISAVASEEAMRGKLVSQTSMLSLRTPEERVPADHPLRRV